jgi:hypothetical protein
MVSDSTNPQIPSSVRAEEVARTIVLTALFAAPALVCMHLAYVADPDVWWHMRTGQWIIEHHSVPYVDPFSRLSMGKEWAAYSWLFDLIVLKFYRCWNLAGILAYSTTMVLVITVALYQMIRRLQPDFTKATLLTMAGMICLSRLYTPRPWLFTILFFVIELDILFQVQKSGKIRKALWLPLIFGLWANLHIQFVDGLTVLGLAALTPLAQRWVRPPEPQIHLKRLWLIWLLSFLATLVNPYGWKIYKIAYELSSQAGVLNSISELQALPFRDMDDFILLSLAVAVVGVFCWNHSFPLFESALVATAIFLSFRSQRDVWLLAISASAILAMQLRSNIEEDWHPRRQLRSTIFLALSVCATLLAGAALMHVSSAALRESVAKVMPVHAVEAVRQRAYSGPLYNNYNWGGYLIWSSSQLVSIDGRAALHGDKLIERSATTWNAGPDWRTDPQLISARLVIAPVGAPLTQLLRADASFDLVFEDQVAAVFVAHHT